jgi:hypothetical protein
MAERRALTIDQLSQVMPEVDRLLEGYTRAGAWSLGQACQHLTKTLTLTVEGLSGRMPWLVRRTVGAVVRRRLLARGRMPEGVKIRPEWGLAPDAGPDDRAEAEALRAALAHYGGQSGSFPEHPFFGPLTRAEWDRLHCIHCAHHLSFLLPTAPGGPQSSHV